MDITLHNTPEPRRASPLAAGFDLCTTVDALIWPFQTVLLPTGIRIALPEDLCALILPRSGMASKRDLAPANSPGLIDPDYRGEIHVALRNYGLIPRRIKAHDRIAQLLFTPFVAPVFRCVEALPATARGEQGFGSTG